MTARRWAGVIVALFFILAAVVSCRVNSQPTMAPPTVATAAPAPVPTSALSPRETTPSPEAMSSPQPSATVTSQAAPKPSEAAVQDVPAAEPVRLDIPGILRADVGRSIDPVADNFELPNTTQVFRWRERGRPGTDSKDTVYLLGHTVRKGGGVFDPLQRVKPGQELVLTTGSGRLRYRVDRTQLYPKNEIQRADEVYAEVPGQLLLIGCYLNQDGSRQTQNFVVFATLVGAEK